MAKQESTKNIRDEELKLRIRALIERKRKQEKFDFKTGRLLFMALYMKAKRKIEIESMH